MGATAGLTTAQQKALECLRAVLRPETYLAGGTALTLRLSHRLSHDLDLFTTGDPEALAEPVSQLPGVVITGRATGTLYLEVEGVPVSVIRYRYPLLAELEHLDTLPVPVVSWRDQLCMKLAAMAARGARRDFWDLHAMLDTGRVSLDEALRAYQEKFAKDDIGYVVRSLSYFAEAEAEPMPEGLADALRGLRPTGRTRN